MNRYRTVPKPMESYTFGIPVPLDRNYLQIYNAIRHKLACGFTISGGFKLIVSRKAV